MPYREPWVTSFGSSFGTGSVVVKLTTNEAIGWGEAAPCRSALYSPEYTAGAYELVSTIIAPRLLGMDINSGEQLQEYLSAQKGNPFAKSVLDVAWWDAYAKSRSSPLWKVIGGKNSTVSVGADLTIRENQEETLDDVYEVLQNGFNRIKLKFGRNSSVSLLNEIRRRYPDLSFHIDCNNCFTLDDLDILLEVDKVGLAMIEQPLAYDDLVDHAKLQTQIATPICLDESIDSIAKAKKAIELKSCQWINIKVGRVGGITPAISIHDLCQEHDMPCWIGSMLESNLGQGASLAMATLPNNKYPSDIFPSDRFYTEDLGFPDIQLSGVSTVTAPDRPGVGYEPKVGMLEKLTINHKRLTL